MAVVGVAVVGVATGSSHEPSLAFRSMAILRRVDTTWQWHCRQDWLPKPCKLVAQERRSLREMQSHLHRSVWQADASCIRPRQQFEIGQRGRTCTCGHSVPGRACCCYTTRCCPGQWLAPGAWFLWRWRPRSLEHILHRRFGGPEGSCTLNLPADTGALC
jgi:hypothetical protein